MTRKTNGASSEIFSKSDSAKVVAFFVNFLKILDTTPLVLNFQNFWDIIRLELGFFYKLIALRVRVYILVTQHKTF